MNKNKHTPVPWRWGKGGAVVTNSPDEQVRFEGEWAADDLEFYGGHVICETVTKNNGAFIVRACNAHDDMLAALELGDSAGNNGPALLLGAAHLLEPFAPFSAMTLRRKAVAEQLAIEKARQAS